MLIIIKWQTVLFFFYLCEIFDVRVFVYSQFLFIRIINKQCRCIGMCLKSICDALCIILIGTLMWYTLNECFLYFDHVNNDKQFMNRRIKKTYKSNFSERKNPILYRLLILVIFDVVVGVVLTNMYSYSFGMHWFIYSCVQVETKCATCINGGRKKQCSCMCLCYFLILDYLCEYHRFFLTYMTL